jgi:hypothetical protein
LPKISDQSVEKQKSYAILNDRLETFDRYCIFLASMSSSIEEGTEDEVIPTMVVWLLRERKKELCDFNYTRNGRKKRWFFSSLQKNINNFIAFLILRQTYYFPTNTKNEADRQRFMAFYVFDLETQQPRKVPPREYLPVETRHSMDRRNNFMRFIIIYVFAFRDHFVYYVYMCGPRECQHKG